MSNSVILKAIPIVSGLVAIAIGGAILAAPAAFYAGYGIVLGGDPNLLSELQGAGGAVLGSGVLIVAGAFVRKLALPATLLSTLLFLGYAAGRAVGMAVYGTPATAIVASGVVELSLGLAGAFALSRYREREARGLNVPGPAPALR